ncbi:MAG: histidine phosphatase family protein [Planctomycetaceae bacterium]
MSTAILIRPGETDFDQQSRIQGRLDLPLSELGRQQVRGLIVRLSELSIESVYSSPTEPALSTAREVAASLDVTFKELDGLGNLSHGLWEGMLLEDVRRKHPRVFRQWRKPHGLSVRRKETCAADAYERVRKAAEETRAFAATRDVRRRSAGAAGHIDRLDPSRTGSLPAGPMLRLQTSSELKSLTLSPRSTGAVVGPGRQRTKDDGKRGLHLKLLAAGEPGRDRAQVTTALKRP